MGPASGMSSSPRAAPTTAPAATTPRPTTSPAGRWPAILAEIQSDPLLQGVTFSGGEPFCQPAPLCAIARAVKGMGKDLVVYSGYTLEQLLERGKEDPAVLELLRLCDTLIDGPYIEAQRDLTLRYRGSANQRVNDLRAAG